MRASLFSVLNRLLSPVIWLSDTIVGWKVYARIVQELESEMSWTITHLRPDIILPADRKLVKSRYATVTLRCPSYFIWITGEVCGATYDFWADVGSLSNPDSRIRIDTLAKEMLCEVGGLELKTGNMIPKTFSDLDSLIRSLAPELEVFFRAN